MKKLIFLICLVVAATLPLMAQERATTSISDITDEQATQYWASLDHGQKLEVIKQYIVVKNADPSLSFPQYQYVTTKDDQLVVFPETKQMPFAIGGVLQYQITYPTLTFDYTPPKTHTFRSLAVGAGAGVVLTLLASSLLQ